MRYKNALLFAALCSILAALAGCQHDGDAGDSNDGLRAAIVPGSDFVMRMDYRAMAESPILENLEPGMAGSTPAASAAPTEAWAKFIETTGLGAESLEAMLVSIDLDTIDMAEGSSKDDQMAAASAVLAVSLDTELTHEDIATGVEAANAENGKARARVDEVGGQRMVRIEIQEEAATRIVYASPSEAGDAVFFSMNPASVRGALEREEAGTVEPIPESLALADAGLAPEAQVRVAFVAPASWRAKIREQVDNPSQGGGMAAGMLSPLKDIQSIALGMAFETDLRVQLVGDLGSDEAAQQASAFLQMMVVPMLRQAMAENGDSDDVDSLDVGVEGTVLQLGMTFSEADVAAFRKKTSTMSAPGIGGGAP